MACIRFSAGVGRTGTLIAARFLLDRLRKSPETIDIFGSVLSLRKWRAHLVQVDVSLGLEPIYLFNTDAGYKKLHGLHTLSIKCKGVLPSGV